MGLGIVRSMYAVAVLCLECRGCKRAEVGTGNSKFGLHLEV